MKLSDLYAAQHDGKLIRNNMYSYRVRENNDNKAVTTIYTVITVMRQCGNDDDESQWEIATFEPSPAQTP